MVDFKKLLQLGYEYYGIFTVTFAMMQIIIGTSQTASEKDRARYEALGQECPEEECNRSIRTCLVLLPVFANHCVLLWWFYMIYKRVTAPYGTLGYVIQAAEVKREAFFKKFIIWTVGFTTFAVLLSLILTAADGSPVGQTWISIILVISSVSPYWMTIGSKVPLSEKCYNIPIRKLESSPFSKADNILSLVEDGIIEMAQAAAADTPLEKAGTLLKEKLKFTDKDLQILQASLTAQDAEREASLFDKMIRKGLEQVVSEDLLAQVDEAVESL